MKQSMSLGWELGEIRNALDAARLLAGQMAHDEFPDGAAKRLAAPAIEAVLALVTLRVDDLCRVLRGELDPVRLIAHHNELMGAAPDDPDVYFRPWKLKKVRAELERVERVLKNRK